MVSVLFLALCIKLRSNYERDYICPAVSQLNGSSDGVSQIVSVKQRKVGWGGFGSSDRLSKT